MYNKSDFILVGESDFPTLLERYYIMIKEDNKKNSGVKRGRKKKTPNNRGSLPLHDATYF